MSRLKPGDLTLAITSFALVLVAGWGSAAGAAEHPAPPWTWPLSPRPTVVAPFDPPEHPWGSGHRGVDLLGRPGQSVVAVAAGTVSFAGRIAGKAVVVIRHGTVRSTYEPVTPAVHVGDRVAAADLIATLTTTHSHCLPATCLHLGAKRGDTYLDPLDFLGGGPIRLKPLRHHPDDVVTSSHGSASFSRDPRPTHDGHSPGTSDVGVRVVGAASLGVVLARVRRRQARG